MKKIISILLVILFFCSNLSLASTCGTATCDDITQKCVSNACVAQTQEEMNQAQCWWMWVYNVTNKTCGWSWTSTTDTSSSTSVMGIDCDQTKLINGQCKLNIYDTLGIRKSVRDTGQATSVGLFVQDVILSATMFIGTLVTIALVVSGIMYILAATGGKDATKAKQGIIGSLVGLLIVVSSYVIIRLVQYIAKGF